MKFFKPKGKKFLEYIEKLVPKRRIIVDIGCGEGHITKLLKKNGFNVVGIDTPMYIAEPYKEAIIIPAEHFEYGKNTIPLCCRPCAGDWYFMSFKKALESGSDFCLFVGVYRNYERDMSGFERYGMKAECIRSNIGEDEDSLYKITKGDKMKTKEEQLVKFCLVKSSMSCEDKPYWYEDGGKYWINHKGGRTPKNEKDIILKTQFAECEADLDWENTCIYGTIEEYEAGYLSPEGRFYGCYEMGHAAIASFIVKNSWPEKLGWIHIYSKNEFWSELEFTEAQKLFLDKHGYKHKLLDSFKSQNLDKYEIPQGENML